MKAYLKNIRQVAPYTPGEQPKQPGIIKLNTNENPYPPSPKVMEQLGQIDRLRMYPDPAVTELAEAIAGYKGLSKDQIFVGVGSDDVLAMCFMTYFNSDLPILFPDITYSFYDVWAELFRVPYETVPLNQDFKIVPDDYKKPNGGIIIANPNAPTGIFMPLDELESIIASNQDVIVIVDEAYVDFGGTSAQCLLDRYENLIVVQTFSKSRSLAGMRIGFAMGSASLIKALNDVKYSFNSYTMNQPSIVLGKASIEDDEYFLAKCKAIMDTREWVKKELTSLGFSFPDSKTNFIFATHESVPAEEIFLAAKEEGIFLRYFKKPRIDNFLRITIGTDEEMKKLIQFLKHYLN